MSPRLRFYRDNLGIPLLLAVLVFCLFDLTNIDRTISNALIDPSTGEFILRHSKLFEDLTHRWPRVIPDWTGELAVIGALLSFIWPRLAAHTEAAPVRFLERANVAPLLRFTTDHRRDLFFVVVAFALTTGVIHYLKAHTSVYCPVETTLYGGKELRVEWFEHFTWLHKAGDGRCWPGGHASSGFTMLALYFVARRYRWQHAKALLGAIVLLGMVFGTTRVLQGWHYMSHTFWAGIFVWLSTFLVALVFYGRTQLDAEPVRKPNRVSLPVGAVRTTS